MSEVNAPEPRIRHTAIWTGSKMIVWGGQHSGDALNDGKAYDPANDTWTTISSTNAPNKQLHTAIWTGSKMIVWGGQSELGAPSLNTGGSYYRPGF